MIAHKLIEAIENLTVGAPVYADGEEGVLLAKDRNLVSQLPTDKQVAVDRFVKNTDLLGKHLAPAIRRAGKFDCGHVDELLPISEPGPESYNLPFSETLFQFRDDTGTQMVLAEKAEEDGLFTGVHPGDIAVVAFNCSSGNVILNPYMGIYGQDDVEEGGIGMEVKSLLPGYPELAESMNARAISDTIRHIVYVQAMIAARVPVETRKAPEKLNRKRAKKKRPPIFEHKVLAVSGATPADDEKSAGSSSENNKKSPRLHLRRGHLRRYRDGKITWVRSSVVGGKKRKGEVNKEYKLQRKQQS